MKKSDFFYNLPPELIAQTPLTKRDNSRMLVYNRRQNVIEHKHFFDIIDYLKKGDVLVVNNTRVLPARIYGQKQSTKGKAEFLLHKRLNLTDWEVLMRPAKRAAIGTIYEISDKLSLKILGYAEDGARIVQFIYEGVFEQILSEVGSMPLPHYIKERLEDKERYQTVYSKQDGSSAAPTAGLHFTNDLVEKIKDKGVEWCEILLHVGLGTFRPVKTDEIMEHKMHSEFYSMSEQTAATINKAKKEGRRIIAVGTTSARVLESCAVNDEKSQNSHNLEYYVRHNTGSTDIFIYPPYQFKIVDALITNFHLPESTLIMMVSAFCGHQNTMKIYEEAVRERYRFFSFGDATFIY